MNTQEKYTQLMKSMNGDKFNNPSIGSLSDKSIGDQEQNQRLMQNTMTAHHTGGGIGLDGFGDITLEGMIQLVKEGKLDKNVLGEDADILLQYGTPSQREKQLEETGSLEIPVMPYEEDEDDDNLSFLKDYISNA
tara:strand:+ start:534 stop:938 length:405 start_codon:yes stop_codon:yes gene_type:complete